MGGIDNLPEPGGTVPEFVVETLDDQSPETLDAVVEYLDGTGGLDDVPSPIVEAATMQDDETVAEMARFSEELASFYRDSDYDSVLLALEDAELADDEGDGETTTLRHGGL